MDLCLSLSSRDLDPLLQAAPAPPVQYFSLTVTVTVTVTVNSSLTQKGLLNSHTKQKKKTEQKSRSFFFFYSSVRFLYFLFWKIFWKKKKQREKGKTRTDEKTKHNKSAITS